VLGGEAELAEAPPEHRGVVGEREHEVRQVARLAVRVLEDDGVVDDEREGVVDAERPERAPDGVDDGRGLELVLQVARVEVDAPARGPRGAARRASDRGARRRPAPPHGSDRRAS
jgi:hypothetical protein